MFQESETLEGFEKKLNDEEAKINNLDLDWDDQIDYIKVLDNVDGGVHTIILQVDVDENEKQDVAVFTVQKDASNKVQVQLVGDEELYGKDYIVEPNMEDAETTSTGETPNPGYTGKTTVVNNQEVVVTNTTTADGRSCISFFCQPMLSGIHPGTGIIILLTGIPGGRFTGIITGVFIQAITIGIMAITAAGIIIVITTGIIFITTAAGPGHRFIITAGKADFTDKLIQNQKPVEMAKLYLKNKILIIVCLQPNQE